ncbi:MAG: rhamnogalacturonan lyase [Candidatus Goldbacteria bacterium]|nr:rhamnogalacturonan lyase [Candidatus Goldiibacteriota bacterium]
MKSGYKKILILFSLFIAISNVYSARYMENLDRGVVAVWLGSNRVWVGWRMSGTDPSGISFNVYRNGTKINSSAITNVTYYIDTAGSQTASYYIRPVVGGVEQTASKSVTPWSTFYKTLPLQIPSGGTTPDGVAYTYNANDCSTGDLDGDGEYEIVLKWDPSNSKDNSQSGYTGNVYLDAYKLNGTRLWRIDLGINIRAGAHYTQFMVYDLDCDGKAEVACKTAPGTKDATGSYLHTGPAASDDDSADYRNSSGYILSGPEYLTVFRGTNGAEIVTVNYVPARGTVSSWGDSYGNRVDRFLACIAYLDGVKPSLVMQRGYYTRMVIAAWDFNGTNLTQRWVFDSNSSGNSSYAGQGNHNLSVGDVDGDGKDEIIQGACAINDNGTGMYVTGLGHGDAMHFGDLAPDRAGLEVWEVHESTSAAYGYELHDARTGAIVWGTYTGTDNGRGLAADIDSRYRGYEMWSTGGTGVYSCTGTQISTSRPTVNFRIYWDGDLLDEVLDGTLIDKWTGSGTTRLLTGYNYESTTGNNGTKNTPCLSADILGDWREELILRKSDNTALVIFTTTTETSFRMYTLMHDPIYRLGIAWQNVAYNQPPHLGFYLYDGNPPTPDIILVGAGTATPVITPTRTRTPTLTLTRTWTMTGTRTSTRTQTMTITPTQVVTAIWRIAAGRNTSYTDSQGNVWLSDRNYNGGLTYNTSNEVTNALPSAADQTLYQNERHGSSFTYTFNVPAGTYQVTLKFAETFWTEAGARIFNVSINGTQVLTNFDIYAAAGGANIAIDEVFNNIQPVGGVITLQFGPASIDGAKVCAIQIIPQPATPTVTRTRTATPTWTRTATRTSTRTNTVQPTNTFTWTRTGTPTWTRTATGTSTRTNTVQPTNTFTWTRTVTPTWTRTATGTATRTNTVQPTNTWTGTRTSTPNLTVTDTISSNTPTLTPTWTRTATGTSTRTNTTQPTSTFTGTRTNTPGLTVTDTISSNTPTITQTWTMTSTLTWTRTITPTMTRTLTGTSTQTNTVQPTNTFTWTRTGTPTWTGTLTSTSTFTQTVTRTFTWTNTPSLTVTVTLTRTHTATLVSTKTITQTATSTVIPDEEELKIEDIVIYPNPYNPIKGDLHIGLNITQACKTMKVRIYTSGFRLVKQITQTGNYTVGRNIIDIENRYIKNLANGSYFVIITATNKQGKQESSKPEILIILR